MLTSWESVGLLTETALCRLPMLAPPVSRVWPVVSSLFLSQLRARSAIAAVRIMPIWVETDSAAGGLYWASSAPLPPPLERWMRRI